MNKKGPKEIWNEGLRDSPILQSEADAIKKMHIVLTQFCINLSLERAKKPPIKCWTR